MLPISTRKYSQNLSKPITSTEFPKLPRDPSTAQKLNPKQKTYYLLSYLPKKIFTALTIFPNLFYNKFQHPVPLLKIAANSIMIQKLNPREDAPYLTSRSI